MGLITVDAIARPTSAARAVEAAQPVRGATAIVAIAIASSLYLQRFVLPVPRISVTFIVLFVLVIVALVLNIGRIRVDRAIVAAVLAVLAGSAVLFSGTWTIFDPTLQSFILLIFAWTPLTVLMNPRAGGGSVQWDRVFLWCTMPAAIAILLQLALQFTPAGFVDPITAMSPDIRFTQHEYSISYEYVWNSGIFKPNGFFFVEPSMAGQYMSLATLAALAVRPAWSPLFVIAMLTTVSGTGIIALLVGLPFAFVRARPALRMMMLVIGGAVAIVAIATPIGNLLADRSDELDSQNTSGSARFVTPFVVLIKAVIQYPLATLAGTGPGTGDSVAVSLDLATANLSFIPKVMIEYGVIFGLLFTISIFIAIVSARAVSGANRAALVTIVFVLSGALLQGPTSLLLWSAAFASAPKKTSDSDALGFASPPMLGSATR